MKVLITGISGFVGSHLTEYLLSKGCKVYGLIRHRCDLRNLRYLENDIKLIEGDVTDAYSIDAVMSKIKPDKVYHLAAQSYVPYSWTAPQETLNVNIQGTINILEAVKKNVPTAFVMLAGSSEEYGLVKADEVPIKETHQLKPLSPYGVSKVALDLLGFQYYYSYGLYVFRTRAFNHTGPKRGSEFVLSQFVRQALDVKGGRKKAIKVGNLDAVRDFTDVRDIVKAYWLVTEKGQYGDVYNICSEEGVSMEMALKTILKVVFGKVYKEVKIEIDKDRLRPSDVPVLIGDCSKFKQKTGWKKQIPFETTINDMVEYISGELSNAKG